MTTASPARIEANRKNAALSTGPRTDEGKAVSRANAFKHGLTGDGVVAPFEDLARIAEIGADLLNQYLPTTTIGRAMLGRAALMMVRLDRAGLVEQAIIDDSVLTATFEFEEFRRDWAEGLFAEISTRPAALDELHCFAEGIDRLIAEWTWVASVEDWSADDLARLARFSDAGKCAPPVIRSMIPGEIDRLEDIKAGLDRRPMELARKRAADLAFFSMEPRAILARRYEAATERAYHKAMETFFEAEAKEEPVLSLPGPTQTAAAVDPMGSFGREVSPPPEPLALALNPKQDIIPVAPTLPVDRSKRPDPRKLREARRRNRR